MAMTFKDFMGQLEQLDNDFSVGSSRRQPPRLTDIQAAERDLKVLLPQDYQDFILHWGCMALDVKEAVWPRAREFEVRPRWQLEHGLRVFGVGIELPEHLSMRAQANTLHQACGLFLAPLFKKVGRSGLVCANPQGQLVVWTRQEPPDLLTESFLELMSIELRQLVEDKTRIKSHSHGVNE